MAVGSLVLLVVAIGLLAGGRFVQFDDTSGFGSNQWNVPIGILAVIPAVAALVVASRHVRARVWLGIGLLVLSALLVLLSRVDRGFRFIWKADEGELQVLETVLVLTAAVLIATGLQPSSRAGASTVESGQGAGRWLVRGSYYLWGTAAVMGAAFLAGVVYYNETYCGAGGDTDCLALLGGMLWSVVSVPVSGVVIAIIELVLWRRRHRHRTESR